MRTNHRVRLAWALTAAAVMLYSGSVVLGIAGRTSASSSWGSAGWIEALAVPTAMLAFPLMGGLIASRRPDNAVGWIMVASGISWCVIFFAEHYATYVITVRPGSLPAPLHVGAVALGLWVPGVGLPATLLLQLFPDGRPISRAWKRFAWASAGLLAIVFLVVALTPDPVANIKGTINPFSLPALRPVVAAVSPIFVLLPFCVLGSVGALVVRYRRSGLAVREQVKWLAFAGVSVGLLFALSTISSLITSAPDGTVPFAVEILQDLMLFSLVLIPVSVGFAVLRYRLFDIDRLISRTLSYAIVTVLIAGTFAIVAVAPSLIVGTGTRSPDWVIAAATLTVAAAFRPILRRVRSAADRRFNRARYDAANTIDSFTTRLRDEVDIDNMGAELEAVVGTTMQPAHVSLWMRNT